MNCVKIDTLEIVCENLFNLEFMNEVLINGNSMTKVFSNQFFYYSLTYMPMMKDMRVDVFCVNQEEFGGGFFVTRVVNK